MATTFTPLLSFGGGLLIGLAAVLLMLYLGRIFGATGILSGFIVPKNIDDLSWRIALLLGMVSAPIVLLIVGDYKAELVVPSSSSMLVLGGFIVGVGVTYGGGCTSGHGVCGNARLSRRSFVATLLFMAAAFVTVFFVRHIFGG